jgi:carbon monoxide dehydrogenase subunit G
MELEHSFTVPVPKHRAWDVLLDVERVAPCMPGASLDSVDGDEIHGRIKVKVGPINMTYAGTARFIEKDEEAGIVTLEASGKETRGAGTASASVRSVLEDRGEETRVTVLTTLNVTGKPAQFGRGVMNEVGGKLLSIFATNLAATLAEPEGTGAEAGAAADSGAAEQPATPATPAASAAAVGAAAAATSSDGAGANGAGTVRSPAADTPVDAVKLPARAAASLQREGITTVGQLATRTEDELLALDGIGPASVVDIKSKLTELGLTLGQPPAAEPAAADAGAVPATGATDAGEASPASGAAGTAASPATTSTATTSTAPASTAPASSGAGSSGAAGSATPHASATREAAHQFEDDAINLLKVAGMPVLKRAIPVVAALAAALLLGLRRKMRRRHRKG